jgi:hypothetical protein
MRCQASSRARIPWLALALWALAGALWSAATAAQDRDLAASANGARVIKYTSEAGGEWRADRLIDGASEAGGWASTDASLPQEIILRLPVSARFNTLVFSVPAGSADGHWARQIAVYTADPFPTMGGWKLVAQLDLKREPGDQVFTVPAIDGRFIRLLITGAQASDAPRVSLGRFKLFMR